MYSAVTMHKAEKYAVDMRRLAPDVWSFLLRNMGCARKVYNLYVDYLYKELEKQSYTSGLLPDIHFPEVTHFKKLYPFLKEADSLALANAKIDFGKAVKHFNEDFDHKSYSKRALRRDKSDTEPLSFRGLKGMPKFHARAKGFFSYTTNCQQTKENKSKKDSKPTIRLEKNRIYLPKLKSGFIPLVRHRDLPEGAVIKNVTVSMDTNGRFFVSVGYVYTYRMDMTVREAVIKQDGEKLNALRFLGLDYSQKDFYIDSNGRKPNCPHAYKQSEERLQKLQKELSRMEEGSNNYVKQLEKIQKKHVKIKNQRKDFIEKESGYLADTFDVIVVEDIDLRSLSACLSLGKNLSDNGFGMFRERLLAKLIENGSLLIKNGEHGLKAAFAPYPTKEVIGGHARLNTFKKIIK